MAKKTVSPDTSAASSPTRERRRSPSTGGRRTAKPAANGATEMGAAPAKDEVIDTAADMRIAGDIDSAAGRTPSYEEIAEAAYRRYLERGGEHGRDFDDWVEAERSLRSGG